MSSSQQNIYFKNLLLEKISKPQPHHLLSQKSAFIYRNAVAYYQIKRSIQNVFQGHASIKKPYLPAIIARHQSLLHKKLGDNNEHLQHQKVTNLKIASQKIDSIVIQPGQTFSYWHLIGKPKAKDGYVGGMLLSRGKVVEGIGGGLCQLSNLLYWLFLHAPFEILQRFHHSYDVFPDSGRVLPFGSGATVFYNYVDLVAKNISKQPLQIKLWLTDSHLKGQILSDNHLPIKYKVREKNHCFVKWQNRFFRYNELYQDELLEGKIINSTLVTKNFAPVLYPVTVEELQQKNYEVIVFDEEKI